MKKLFLSAAVLLNTLVCINHVHAQWTTVGSVISQTDTTKKVSIGTKSNTSDLYVARNNAAAAIGVRSGTSNAILNMDKGSAGSNSAVAYKSQGVTSWNTGMLGNNNYSIKNVVTGTFPLVVNSADNVGIGTATPNSKLDVEGNATGGEVFRFSNDKNGTKDSTMVMTGNGRVGIGTTSPTSKFNVNGQVTIDQKNFGGYGGLLIKGNAPGSNHPNIGFSLYNDADVDVIAGFIQGNPTNTSPGNESMDLAFYTSTTGTGGLAARVYVKDDGKVGIGNSNPSETLDVTGNAQTSGSIYVDGAQTNAGFASDNGIRFGGPGSGELISSQRVTTFPGNQYGLDFYTASNKRLSIDVDGRVGIGTPYPGQQLQVYNGTTTGSYTTSGWVHSSDARLKTNIKPIINSLQKILMLQGVSYNWKKNADANPQIGFIAQEVEKVFPEVVVVDKDGNYAMAPQNLTGPIVEAIKELNNKLEAKEAEIANLKKENARIDNQVTEMKSCIETLCNSASTSNSRIEEKTEQNVLFQNQPNPFSETTVIGYQLTGNYNSAKVIIRNLNGEIMRTIAINQTGKGEVVLNANELKQGTYTYSLMLNDKCADTKLMVITK